MNKCTQQRGKHKTHLISICIWCQTALQIVQCKHRIYVPNAKSVYNLTALYNLAVNVCMHLFGMLLLRFLRCTAQNLQKTTARRYTQPQVHTSAIQRSNNEKFIIFSFLSPSCTSNQQHKNHCHPSRLRFSVLPQAYR